MANDARMTVRLDPATRRKLERFAAREGISLNQAINSLLQRAPDQGERPARRLAGEMSDECALRKLKGRR